MRGVDRPDVESKSPERGGENCVSSGGGRKSHRGAGNGKSEIDNSGGATAFVEVHGACRDISGGIQVKGTHGTEKEAARSIGTGEGNSVCAAESCAGLQIEGTAAAATAIKTCDQT